MASLQSDVGQAAEGLCGSRKDRADRGEDALWFFERFGREQWLVQADGGFENVEAGDDYFGNGSASRVVGEDVGEAHFTSEAWRKCDFDLIVHDRD